MNIDHFLSRIGLAQRPDVSHQGLDLLQSHFVQHVPFENLDIMAGIKLDYSAPAAFDKIVTRQRGGVCYENNSLFYWALKSLGFEARLIAAEMFPAQQFRQHFDHMALLVCLDDGEYLVDVGNGKYFGSPLNIAQHEESQGEGVRYKILPFAEGDLSLCYRDEGQWKVRYGFKREGKTLDDFLEVCHFTETSAQSAFTQGRLVTRWTGSGRVTLSKLSLTKSDEKGKTQQDIAPEELEAILRQHFALEYTHN